LDFSVAYEKNVNVIPQNQNGRELNGVMTCNHCSWYWNGLGHIDPHAGNAFDNHVTLTFDLLTSSDCYALYVYCSLPSLMSIALAIFQREIGLRAILHCRNTKTQTTLTKSHTQVATDHYSDASAPPAWVTQESCAIANMTARCADKSKQTATPPPKIT